MHIYENKLNIPVSKMEKHWSFHHNNSDYLKILRQAVYACKLFEWDTFRKHSILGHNSSNLAFDHIQHRENSPITHSTPEPTLLSWGAWPCERKFPHAWPRHKASLIALIRPLRPHRSRILWCYSGVSWMSNLLEKFFSAHYTSICKLNRISRSSISKVAEK